MKVLVLMAVLLSAGVARGEGEGAHSLITVQTFKSVGAQTVFFDARIKKPDGEGTFPIQIEVRGRLTTTSRRIHVERGTVFPNYEAMRDYVKQTYCTPNFEPKGEIYFVPITEYSGSSLYRSRVPEEMRSMFRRDTFHVEAKYRKGANATIVFGGNVETFKIRCNIGHTPMPRPIPSD